MITEVIPYFITQFSRIVNFLFNLKINENPSITLGEYILTFAFIGLVIQFIFGANINIGNFGNSDINKGNSGNSDKDKK